MSEVGSLVRVGTAPTIAVRDAGEGAAVVFLHGVGGRRTDWAEQQRHFSQHYRTLAWDARGYGDSDDYAGAASIELFADDLARVLDTLGIIRAHLVGLSMGGYIAQAVASRHPDRIVSLTLADTSISLQHTLGAHGAAQFLAARREPLEHGTSLGVLARTIAPNLLAPGAGEDLIARVEMTFATLRGESYLKALGAVVGFRNRLDLLSVRVPTLVIVGEHDTLLPPTASRALADAIPGARYVELRGAGHLSNLEQPVAFNAALEDFLASCRLQECSNGK